MRATTYAQPFLRSMSGLQASVLESQILSMWPKVRKSKLSQTVITQLLCWHASTVFWGCPASGHEECTICQGRRHWLPLKLLVKAGKRSQCWRRRCFWTVGSLSSAVRAKASSSVFAQPALGLPSTLAAKQILLQVLLLFVVKNDSLCHVL